MSEKLKEKEWKPDFGPSAFNQKSGVTAIGVRDFLIAYNVNLNTVDKRKATDIALDIREKGRAKRDLDGKILRDKKGKIIKVPGKLKNVKAVGWYIDEYSQAQVSMNLTNGVILPLNVSLDPVPAFGVSGMVTNSSGVGIANAEVLIYNPNISQSVTTDVNGAFSINSVSGQYFYDDYYEVVVGKWSYRTSCNNQYIGSTTNNLSIVLDDGYYDDLFIPLQIAFINCSDNYS